LVLLPEGTWTHIVAMYFITCFGRTGRYKLLNIRAALR